MQSEEQGIHAEVMDATEAIRALQNDLGYLADLFDSAETRRKLAFPKVQRMAGMGVMLVHWRDQLRSICESLNEMEAQTDGFRFMAKDEYPEDVILSDGYEDHPVRLFAHIMEAEE